MKNQHGKPVRATRLFLSLEPWVRRLPPVLSSSGIEGPPLSLPKNIRIFLRTGIKDLPRANLDACVLLMCLRGKGEIVVDDRPLRLRPGYALLLFPRQTHWYRNLPQRGMQWLFMSFQLGGEDVLLPLKNVVFRWPNPAGRYLDAILQDYVGPQRRAPNVSGRIVVTVWLLLLELVAAAGRRRRAALMSAGRRLVIEKIHRYILDHLHESFHIRDVAHAAGVSASTARALIRDEIKIGLGGYIHRERMRRACLLLASPGASIKQVASDCGYSSVSVFCRAFRRMRGKSPSRYRKFLRHCPV